MDKLKAMQTYVRIAEAGSLTAAANDLGASLPAVVRSLAALEAQLGVRLINRTTRRLSLTEEGRHYLDTCRQVLSAVEDGESALTAEAAEPAGQLSITAPVLFGQMHVAPAVTRFVQRYEKMRCGVQLHDRVVDLLEEGIDVGIRIGPLTDSSLVAQQIGSLRRVTVASPAYLRRFGTPRHPRDLQAHNCVRFVSRVSAGWPYCENGKPFIVPVSGNLEFNQAAPAVQACVEGLGLGNFLSYQPAPFVRGKQLKVVLQEFEPPPRPINLVYPHARLLPARTKVFIEWMKQEFRGFKP
ncbi:MAG TPA: LysR family transcriptional regulator [Burkholderiales bacterium]|jgi:DNA-binding transcriptional LysR family regulator|nr:LysR family transcriptional regulator [Burkholderiales bacterium]